MTPGAYNNRLSQLEKLAKTRAWELRQSQGAGQGGAPWCMGLPWQGISWKYMGKYVAIYGHLPFIHILSNVIVLSIDHIFNGEIHLMILDLMVQSNSAFADFEWMKPNTKGRSKDFGPDVFTGRVKCKSESAPSLECNYNGLNMIVLTPR